MLSVRYTTKFKKDFKLMIQRGYDVSLLEKTIRMLCKPVPLSEEYSDHALKGEYLGHRECHIAPDWLLIYKIEKNIETVSLTRTGTHSDLF